MLLLRQTKTVWGTYNANVAGSLWLLQHKQEMQSRQAEFGPKKLIKEVCETIKCFYVLAQWKDAAV